MYNKCDWKTKLSNSEFIHPVGPAPDREGKPWTQCWRTGCSRDLDIKGRKYKGAEEEYNNAFKIGTCHKMLYG
jgi:hypothetical protein